MQMIRSAQLGILILRVAVLERELERDLEGEVKDEDESREVPEPEVRQSSFEGSDRRRDSE